MLTLPGPFSRGHEGDLPLRLGEAAVHREGQVLVLGGLAETGRGVGGREGEGEGQIERGAGKGI